MNVRDRNEDNNENIKPHSMAGSIYKRQQDLEAKTYLPVSHSPRPANNGTKPSNITML